MKLRFVLGITMVIFLVSMCIGLHYKGTYVDWNEEENVIDDYFIPPVLNDDLIDMQLENWDQELDDSPIIVAVQCEDTFYYRFKCSTQKVRVEHVFKGEELKEGDTIEVQRISEIFTSEEMRFKEKFPVNLNFVNEMIPGKTYLVFLERKVNTYNDDDAIYLLRESIMDPVFCYDEIENTLVEKKGLYMTYYKDVKDSEFFIKSEETNEKLQQYKEKLFSKYAYE